MPVVLRRGGLRFFFFANEGEPREPRHIHVRQGKNEAKFWLQTVVTPAYNRGFNAREQRRILRMVEEHQEQLTKAWDDYFS